MEYLIGILILVGLLIFVHELGHFAVAKLLGVKVLKFSLGFPPTIVSRRWGETEYMIGSIPLGGYVKLLGEDPDSQDKIAPEELPRAFSSKSLLARAAIIVAGPASNYLMAILILCAGYIAGMPVPASKIGKVLEESPALEAGIREGDHVVAIDGAPVSRWDQMSRVIEKSAGREVSLTVERSGDTVGLVVTPRVSKRKDVFGNPLGEIGVMSSRETVALGLYGSIYEGCRFTFILTGLVVETIAKLAKAEISVDNLAGPITIVQASGQSLKKGVFSFIFLLAFISINLAILNLLPVPILDGGHLMFFLVEAIIRRPVTGRIRELATLAGIMFIVLLMVVVFYNDITRIIYKGWELKPP